jgi:purine nucleosidase
VPAHRAGIRVTKIHLDTDLGSDTDDLCALAMLLGWPGAEVVGVTTSIDRSGQRAGFVEYALALAGRTGIPVVAGADGSIGGLFSPVGIPGYWPDSIDARPSPAGAATELLEASATAGAVVVSVGPYTNLAMLEAARPGLLSSGGVVLMGGHHTSSRPGLPDWGMRDDFNVQQDPVAAAIVFERCDPVDVPLAVSLEVTLRGSHLEALRDSGPLGRLIADQGEMHARDHGRAELAHRYPGLPDDLLNFHYDPLACATALGWDGVKVETLRCAYERESDGLLRMTIADEGAPLRTATGVDAARFEASWLNAVCTASATASP